MVFCKEILSTLVRCVHACDNSLSHSGLPNVSSLGACCSYPRFHCANFVFCVFCLHAASKQGEEGDWELLDVCGRGADVRARDFASLKGILFPGQSIRTQRAEHADPLQTAPMLELWVGPLRTILDASSSETTLKQLLFAFEGLPFSVNSVQRAARVCDLAFSLWV